MQSKRLQNCLASSELRDKWKPCIPGWGAEDKAMFHRLYALDAFRFVDKRNALKYRDTQSLIQTATSASVVLDNRIMLDNMIGMYTYNVIRIHKDVLYLARMMVGTTTGTDAHPVYDVAFWPKYEFRVEQWAKNPLDRDYVKTIFALAIMDRMEYPAPPEGQRWSSPGRPMKFVR